MFDVWYGRANRGGVSAERPRGHSSLTAAADAHIGVARDAADNVVATTHDVKDGPSGTVITSRLRVVELGTDDDGEIITSCIIEPVEGETAARAVKLPDKVKAVYDALARALVDAGEKPPASNHVPQGPDIRVCPVEVWRGYFYQASVDKPDTRQKSFVRGVDKLKSLGLIGVWNEYAWLARHAGHGRTSDICPGTSYPDGHPPPS